MKKILIINDQSINNNNSTGITVRSIINYFDNDDLLEVYYFPMFNSDIEGEFLSMKLKSKTKPFYDLIRKVYKGKIRNQITTSINDSEVNNKYKFLSKIKKIIISYDDWLKPNIKKNQEILRLIESFNPDIIYTLGASIFSLRMANFFSNEYEIPIVLHYMDNWRETTYNNSKLMYLPRKALIRELEKVESNMNYGMTISDEMAVEYEKISGIKHLSLMHTVRPLKRLTINNSNEKQFNFVYAGGLHLERWKSLKEIEKAIKKIANPSIDLKMIIYTSSTDKMKYENQFNSEIVEFRDYVPHSEVMEIYKISDVMIHVESFDPDLITFTKYSLSTKIPEYMGSGKPILCYAPNSIASYKYIESSESGISVSNYDDLIIGVKTLVNNKKLRTIMGNNGLEQARSKHSENYKSKILAEVFELKN